jgi:hypothetical protein
MIKRMIIGRPVQLATPRSTLVAAYHRRGYDRAIFERQPWCGHVNVQDAEDAYEMCSCLEGKNKDDCYLAFGVDGERVEKYLVRVKALNHQLAKTPQDEKPKSKPKFSTHPAAALIMLVFAIMFDRD